MSGDEVRVDRPDGTPGDVNRRSRLTTNAPVHLRLFSVSGATPLLNGPLWRLRVGTRMGGGGRRRNGASDFPVLDLYD